MQTAAADVQTQTDTISREDLAPLFHGNTPEEFAASVLAYFKADLAEQNEMGATSVNASIHQMPYDDLNVWLQGTNAGDAYKAATMDTLKAHVDTLMEAAVEDPQQTDALQDFLRGDFMYLWINCGDLKDSPFYGCFSEYAALVQDSDNEQLLTILSDMSKFWATEKDTYALKQFLEHPHLPPRSHTIVDAFSENAAGHVDTSVIESFLNDAWHDAADNEDRQLTRDIEAVAKRAQSRLGATFTFQPR